MGKTIYIVPDQGRWAVKQDDGRSIKFFNTRDEAEVYGLEKAKENMGELFVHGLDGSIIRRESHGNDSSA